MKEIIDLLLSHLRMMWLYRWVAMSSAAAIAFIGWFVVLALPNQFEVSAKVFVDSGSMLRPLLQGMVVNSTLAQDSALLMRRTLLTRPNLEQVARRTDMDLNAQTPEAFDRLITELGSRISITSPRGEDIYTVSYKNSDPKLAKKVVDELLNTFFESALGGSREDRSVTQKFLDEQIADYEKKLVEGEERLKDFKQKNMGLLPGSGPDYFARQQEARGQLDQAKLELSEALRRRDELKRQLDDARTGANDEEALFGMRPQDMALPSAGAAQPTVTQAELEASSPEVMQLSARIQAMQAKLDELLLQYTDKHPDIVALRETIAQLEKKKADVIKALPPPPPPQPVAGPSGPGGPVVNPIIESLTINLSDAEATAAALTTRVQEYEERARKASEMANTTLQVEAELKRLDRDYGLFKQQYDQLIERREAARMSQQAEQTASDMQLKMLEPPRLPLAPVGPNRPLLLSGVFGGSLAAALGLALLLAQLNPRIFTRLELQQVTGLPVLGAVSLVSNRWRKSEKRMELAFFGLVFLLLSGFYGGLMTLQLLEVDLHGYLSRVVGVIV